MPKVSILAALFCLTIVTATSGCSNSETKIDENQSGTGQSNEVSANENADSYAMTVQTYNKQKGDYDKGEIIKQPDETEVKRQFQALNWNDTNLRPSVKFVRMSQGKIRSMFVLRRNQESEEGEIEAQWLNLEDQKSVARMSSAIETPETALNLILLYHNGKPELKQAVSWTIEQ